MNPMKMIVSKKTNLATSRALRPFILVCVLVLLTLGAAYAQEIKLEDRIGSKEGHIEIARFEHLTALVKDGKLTKQQGYDRWKRITSDKAAVRQLMGEAVRAGELTEDQVERLMPVLDMKLTYVTNQHRHVRPKQGLENRSIQGR